MAASTVNIGIAAAVILSALLFSPVSQRLTTLGITRGSIKNIHGVDGLRTMPGTNMCEDLHLESTTNQLFAACQQDAEQRARWFPPTGLFADHTATGGGAIVRIDPVSMTAKTLTLKGFNQPMVTHGIDILNDPTESDLLWIYVVSHLPNPDRWDVKPRRTDLPPERAHIEIFTHRLGTDEAQHIRSVRHPDITMPNDIVAVSPSSFYVTNDHVHHEGLIRAWEDAGTQSISPTPNTILIEVTDLKTKSPTAGIKVRTALRVHNNNGLGRGSPHHPSEIIVLDATGGILTRTTRDPKSQNLHIIERIPLASTLDNPSYYLEPFATSTSNASGYLLPGLPHAYKMMADLPFNDRAIPSLVWHVRSKDNRPVDKAGPGKGNVWEKRLVFQDDGMGLRSASGAVLVGIDPERNGGRKQGWLFVTGFGSFGMVAVKIDLE
ncbi:hypothetical protein M409DRAFT_67219 [Zasmidium cellare ATCC 36951]|uniref:Serum paraoxonase/arylesterase family protein n=1 Tax=Zasmidium cellare ATCC 36951 TaxID=1080233 RepID=A0A6A6CE49_ZASCE|nr:uncharacterized protein M409DRAFT_67219 [Zasmidium cellare ATCC 36951]KAF2165361.1 hypothetical protein M409DRAFT_67219 [Zasmidium cellare ATCC 36951]